jgi:hypothetical protein
MFVVSQKVKSIFLRSVSTKILTHLSDKFQAPITKSGCMHDVNMNIVTSEFEYFFLIYVRCKMKFCIHYNQIGWHCRSRSEYQGEILGSTANFTHVMHVPPLCNECSKFFGLVRHFFS